MLILGLTGSIGMGKSTAASYFNVGGYPVFDADGEVHALYAGAAAPLIEQAFPGTVRDGVVDRSALTVGLGGSPENFARLEAIVHPLVRDRERSFLNQSRLAGACLVVLEIPLLFETGADKFVDVTLVVSTDPVTQRTRVLSRPGMTEQKFNTIISRQMSDAEKRSRADFVVDTSGSVGDTTKQIDQVLQQLGSRSATAYQRFWT